MRAVALLGLAASACYTPSAEIGAPCTPAVGNCPAGQSCVANTSGVGYVCSSDGGGGGPDASRGSPDANPDASGLCFGHGLVHDVCFTQMPSGTLTVSAATAIDTASVGGADCGELRPQAGGPPLCVIAKQTITIAAGATLRASGPNPVVLIATDTLTIDGTLDVSSKRGGTAGAGARALCGTGLAGTQGSGTNGGGGGAGGSFGGVGGRGGVGVNMTPSGIPSAAMPPAVLIGGCPGGAGGGGSGGGGAGLGGVGGGAVYLIANALSIRGVINASGAAGLGGFAGINSSGAGGGGGSGGVIGIDAPGLAITGSLFANGGGGGGGGGNTAQNVGQPGTDPTGATLTATGGRGGNNGGGNGGGGFAGTTAPAVGGNGGNQYCAGGGGGGGAGVIKIFQSTLGGGTVSPAPS